MYVPVDTTATCLFLIDLECLKASKLLNGLATKISLTVCNPCFFLLDCSTN